VTAGFSIFRAPNDLQPKRSRASVWADHSVINRKELLRYCLGDRLFAEAITAAKEQLESIFR